MAGFNLKDTGRTFERPTITLTNGVTYTGNLISFRDAVPLIQRFKDISIDEDRIDPVAVFELVPDMCHAFGFPEAVIADLLGQPFIVVVDAITYLFSCLPGTTPNQSRKSTNTRKRKNSPSRDEKTLSSETQI